MGISSTAERRPVYSRRVLIVPATLSDVTYVGANMRDIDRHEILCQLPEGTSGSDAAAMCFAGTPEGFMFTAHLDGQPVAAYGIGPLNYVVWGAWAFGTKRMPRTLPAINRQIWAEIVPKLIEAGCRRVEARPISTYKEALLWISRMGGIRVPGDLPDHGRGGEVFELWAWTLSDYLKGVHDNGFQGSKASQDP